MQQAPQKRFASPKPSACLPRPAAAPPAEAWQSCGPQGQRLCPREAGDIAPFLRGGRGEASPSMLCTLRTSCSPSPQPRDSPHAGTGPAERLPGFVNPLFFFFFKSQGMQGKKNHPSPSDSAICKVRAVINLSITGFRLVRCPRLQAGTGLSWSHTNQPHRESRVLFAGWAWVPLCLSRDSSEATQHPGTLPADHTAIAKPCHGQGARPSAGSFPPHKPLCKQGENLLLTALQHLNGLKLFIRATTRPSPLL